MKVSLVGFVFALMLAFLMVPSITPAATPVAGLVIPDATSVMVLLSEDVSSAKVTQGQEIHFRVAEDVIVDNTVVIRADAPVSATVLEVKKKGKFGKAGMLIIQFDTVRAVNGQNVRLMGHDSREGENRHVAVGAVGVAALAVFPPAGLAGLFIHGKDVEWPKDRLWKLNTIGDHRLVDMVNVRR